MMKRITLRIRAVVFDMDGVITNTMPDHYRAWKKVFSEIGIKVNRLDVYSREGQSGFQSILEICRERDRPCTAREARVLLSRKERLFKRNVRIRFIPGARRFLRQLRRSGFLLGLVTGTARQEVAKMLSEDITRLFSVIVTASDVCNGKPHPEPYLKAVGRLKVRPRDAVAIENASSGIRSARMAGLWCVALETSLPKVFLSEAEAVYPNIRVLRQNVTFHKKV